MKEKSRSYNSARNIILGFGCQLVTMIFAFATRTTFVRLLGVEYTGVNGLFSNILTLLSLTELGIGQVLVFNLYRPIKEKNETLINQYLLFFRKIYYCIALTVFILGVVLIPFLPYIIKECSLPMSEIRVYYFLYLVNSVASYFVVDKVTLLQADQKVFVKTVTHACASVLMHSIMIIYLLFFKSFVGYLLIQVSFTVLQNLFLNGFVNKMYPFIRKKTDLPSTEFKRSVVKSVKSMFLYKMSGVVISYTDNILISMILGVAVVGSYTNYYLIITYLTTFIGYMTIGMAASLGNFNVEQEPKKSYEMFRNMLYFFSLVTIFCVSCYSTMIQGFIQVWIGEQYLLDYKVVIAIMCSFYIVHIISPVWMYRESMGMFSQIKYVLVITALLNIVFSIGLGAWIGLPGIIIATGLSRLLTEVWYEPIILFKQKFGEKPINYFVFQLKQLLLNGAILVTCITICYSIPNKIGWLMVKGIICTAVIIVYEVVFMRKTDEFLWITKKCKGLMGKVVSKVNKLKRI